MVKNLLQAHFRELKKHVLISVCKGKSVLFAVLLSVAAGGHAKGIAEILRHPFTDAGQAGRQGDATKRLTALEQGIAFIFSPMLVIPAGILISGSTKQ